MAVEYLETYPGRPVIVFLHDSLGCIQLWRDFPHKLAEACQCNILLYDRLGYGRSEKMIRATRPVKYLENEADVLDELLTELRIDDAFLFGHSDGGSIALITAAKYPEKVKALVCEAAHIFVEEITLKGIYAAMEAYKTTDLAQRLQKYHGNKVNDIFRAWTETWTGEAFRTWNIEHFLPSITCPLLFIQGTADEYGTMEQVEKTITKTGGASGKLIIPDIGHTPHKEAPLETLAATADFIKVISNLSLPASII